MSNSPRLYTSRRLTTLAGDPEPWCCSLTSSDMSAQTLVMNTASPIAIRAMIAGRLVAAIDSCFPHPKPKPYEDGTAQQMLFEATLAAWDRASFVLACRAFLAGLGNGHTAFSDAAAPIARIGFYARPLGSDWTVTRSRRLDVKPGDVIHSLDGEPMEALWSKARPYVSASREASAQASFLFHIDLLPTSCKRWILADGRGVPFTDSGPPSAPEEVTLCKGSGSTIVLRLPNCMPETVSHAVEQLVTTPSPRSLILDLRGNGGGATPNALIRRLVRGYWRSWTDVSVLRDGLDLAYGVSEPMLVHRPSSRFDGAADAFDGPLAVLIDPLTASAAEDLVLALRDGRGDSPVTLIGENTAGTTGQPYFADLGDKLSFRVAAKRCLFPSGAPFEGIGFAPDVIVVPSPDTVAAGHDEALEAAKEAVR